MDPINIFWPVLAQVALTISMFIVLGIRKARAIKSDSVNRKEAALNNQVWPADVIQVSNNIANQFETPILFYVLCFVFYISNGVSYLVLSLAWAYSLSRFVHAFVHIGSNYVPARMRVFLFGSLILLSMTALAIIEMASQSLS